MRTLPPFHFDHIRRHYEVKAKAHAKAERSAEWRQVWLDLINRTTDARLLSEPLVVECMH